MSALSLANSRTEVSNSEIGNLHILIDHGREQTPEICGIYTLKTQRVFVIKTNRRYLFE
jgi:hypothetical protein